MKGDTSRTFSEFVVTKLLTIEEDTAQNPCFSILSRVACLTPSHIHEPCPTRVEPLDGSHMVRIITLNVFNLLFGI